MLSVHEAYQDNFKAFITRILEQNSVKLKGKVFTVFRCETGGKL